MSLKFSHQSLLLVRWLPQDPAVIWQYHHKFLGDLIEAGVCTKTLDGVDHQRFSLVILEFKKLIEEDPAIFRDFHEMFDQVLPRQDKQRLCITNYMLLLAALNKLITTAPPFHWENALITGVPMYAVIAPFANTQAGYRAFTNAKVNAMILKMFDAWSRFLVSPASRNALATSEGGWFSPKALEVQAKRLEDKFENVWVCDTTRPHWGFASWDDFFVRRFREKRRPVVDPDNGKCINNPCEAIGVRLATGVQAMDRFWVKEQPYSLDHILNGDPLASQFVDGTVFQGVLSSLDYHRWHSPVNGRVIRAYVVPGTYYAPLVDQDPDIDVITRSVYFQTAITTRACIYFQSDNHDIGLMCFVAVGLVEVSTCKLGVKEGDRVKKGDEIGSFHFGGSTHLLIFRPETKLTLTEGPEQPADPKEPRIARRVNSALFYVENRH